MTTIATSAQAVGANWTFHGPVGPGNDWWGEKVVAGGGKFVACATSSAALVTAIHNVERNADYCGPNGPRDAVNWKGHI